MFHPALFKGANVVVTGAGRGIGHGDRAAVPRLRRPCAAAMAGERPPARCPISWKTPSQKPVPTSSIPTSSSKAASGAILQQVDSPLPAYRRAHQQCRHHGRPLPRRRIDGRGEYETVVRLNQTSVVEGDARAAAVTAQGTGRRHRQHGFDLGADRGQPRIGDLFGNQGFRLDLFQGPGARARA